MHPNVTAILPVAALPVTLAILLAVAAAVR